IQPRVTLPRSMSWAVTRFTMLAGIAKPMPWPVATMAVLMPMTSPRRFSSGPPELPGLMEASVDEVLVGRDPDVGAPDGADDADGDRLIEPERIADGNGPFPHAESVGVAERGDTQLPIRVELDDRQVGLRVGADDASAHLLLGCKPHGDAVGALDHVEVGEHVAALVDDDARAETGRSKLFPLTRSAATEELVEEVLEERIVGIRAGDHRRSA